MNYREKLIDILSPLFNYKKRIYTSIVKSDQEYVKDSDDFPDYIRNKDELGILDLKANNIYYTDNFKKDNLEELFLDCKGMPPYGKKSHENTKYLYAESNTAEQILPNNNPSLEATFRYCYNLLVSDVQVYSGVITIAGIFYNCFLLQKVNCASWDLSTVIHMYDAFNSCSSLTELDTSNWDLSNVTNMSSTFYNCSSLTELDTSNWDLSNATNMSNTFYNCSSLTELDTSNWDLSNATNMNNTFYNCSSLTELDTSNWDLSNVTNMSSTFYNCSSLTELDTSNWDLSNVTTMNSTFYNCSSLTELDTSNWDLSNVTNMNNAFYNCSSLTELDTSNWDLSNATNMNNTFYNCSSLTELDTSNWDLSNVTNMNSTFYNCSSLTELDFSQCDLSNVTTMNSTFYNCSSLTELDFSQCDLSNVTTYYNCFWKNTNNLHTLKGLNYNNIEYEYTNKDGKKKGNGSTFESGNNSGLNGLVNFEVAQGSHIAFTFNCNSWNNISGASMSNLINALVDWEHDPVWVAKKAEILADINNVSNFNPKVMLSGSARNHIINEDSGFEGLGALMTYKGWSY